MLVFLILWRGHYAKRTIPSLLLVITTIAALGWGMVEVSSFAKREEPRARLRDDILAVANRMTTMANEDGSLQAAFDGKAPFPTVFTPTLDATLGVFMAIPADSPLAVLWSLHTDAVSLSVAESKDRFYHHMYYSGLSPKELAAGISGRRFWIVAPLFGVERVYDGLAIDRKAISGYELHEERRHYTDFCNNFMREQAVNPTLNFVVVSNGDDPPNLGNLDKWYERDNGQTVGAFTIYRVKLRP